MAVRKGLLDRPFALVRDQLAALTERGHVLFEHGQLSFVKPVFPNPEVFPYWVCPAIGLIRGACVISPCARGATRGAYMSGGREPSTKDGLDGDLAMLLETRAAIWLTRAGDAGAGRL